MPKQNGHLTKEMILKVAEELFSEKGFDGTSVNMIAKTAGVNKSLIYYHFKDKNDLIGSLFEKIIKDVEIRAMGSPKARNLERDDSATGHGEKIIEEIKLMERWKKILSLMLMESLKDSDKDNFLFQCASIVYNQHLGITIEDKGPEERKRFVSEFFTGFIPIIAFIALQDKWCDYFKSDIGELRNDFFEAFLKTHLHSH